jgi:hypothetical protein
VSACDRDQGNKRGRRRPHKGYLLPFNAELEGLYVLGKIIAALLRNACVDRNAPLLRSVVSDHKNSASFETRPSGSSSG